MEDAIDNLKVTLVDHWRPKGEGAQEARGQVDGQHDTLFTGLHTRNKVLSNNTKNYGNS